MRSFTLVELIVVIVIIGILATLAMPAFRVTQERSVDREATASLRLIAAAEKIYRMEFGAYYISAFPHEQEINTYLKLSLPSGATRNWSYITVADNAAIPPTYCVQATRNILVGVGRTWRIRNNEEDPDEGGTCP